MADERTREALGQADPALRQGLDDESLDRVTGAGNPFDGIPRPDPQPIDPDARENG